jgi:hypothetical protein
MSTRGGDNQNPVISGQRGSESSSCVSWITEKACHWREVGYPHSAEAASADTGDGDPDAGYLASVLPSGVVSSTRTGKHSV